MKKVLIVEDDLLIADMVAEVLAGEGYGVCGIARTVEEALALADQHKPELALVDVRFGTRRSWDCCCSSIDGQNTIRAFFMRLETWTPWEMPAGTRRCESRFCSGM